MRHEKYALEFNARHLVLLVITLALPLPSAAQEPELLWSFDTEG